MDRTTADQLLQSSEELVPCSEGSIAQSRELERKLLENDIAAMLARPPPKACCAGGCGCGAKAQLLVREEDVSRVARLMQQDWMDALEREGTAPQTLVQLGVPAEGAEPPCPACGFAAALVNGACADCGLQLE